MMADVTGGTPPTNASPFGVPADIKAVYDHFGDQTYFSVASAASLPGTGNWLGRTLMAEDTKVVYRCTGLPGTWTQEHLLTDSGWTAPTLINSWAVADSLTVGYRRLNGVVRFRGRISGGSTGVAFVLPAGFRPAQSVFAGISSGGSTSFADTRVFVESNGNVNVVAGAAPNLSSFPSFIAEV